MARVARHWLSALLLTTTWVAAAPASSLAQYEVYDIPVTRTPEWSDVYYQIMAVDDEVLLVASLTLVHVYHREPAGTLREIQVIAPADVAANNINGLRLAPDELFVGRDRSARIIHYTRTGTGASTRFEERARIAVPGATLTGFGLDVRGDRLLISDPYATSSVYRDGRAFVLLRGGDGTCGDGACSSGESCPADCDTSPTCGDGRCDPVTEPCGCPADCGERVCWRPDVYASGTSMECPHLDSDEENWCGWTARFTSDDELVLGANRRVVTPYRRGASGWERGAQFGLTGRTPYVRYGLDMEVTGDRLVIGGPGEGAGVVDVFERSAPGADWGLSERIASPVASPMYDFGSEVGLDPTHLVVASGERVAARVYVYERQATRWVLIAVLENDAGYSQLTSATIALDWPSVFVAWTDREPHVIDTFRLRRYTFACDGDCPPYVAPAVDAGVVHDAGPTDAGPTDTGPRDAGALDAGAMDVGMTDAGATDDADVVPRVALACTAAHSRDRALPLWLGAVTLALAVRRRR